MAVVTAFEYVQRAGYNCYTEIGSEPEPIILSFEHGQCRLAYDVPPSNTPAYVKVVLKVWHTCKQA